jgi:hypothetical protein
MDDRDYEPPALETDALALFQVEPSKPRLIKMREYEIAADQQNTVFQDDAARAQDDD